MFAVIKLTRLNGKEFWVNADLIETVEATPDTVVTLATGKKYVVVEKPSQVVELFMVYKRRANLGPLVKGSAGDV